MIFMIVYSPAPGGLLGNQSDRGAAIWNLPQHPVKSHLLGDGDRGDPQLGYSIMVPSWVVLSSFSRSLMLSCDTL